MSLFLVTLLSGLFFSLIGIGMVSGNTVFSSTLKAFPRSRPATILLFGSAALWFLYRVWTLSPADFGEYRLPLFIGFAAVAALSFHYVPDFLSVRGLSGLILLTATPVLDAAFMEWDHPQRTVLSGGVYLLIFAAIWLGAQPWRMRDAIEWLYRQPGRPRLVGGVFLGYGAVLGAIAFTY